MEAGVRKNRYKRSYMSELGILYLAFGRPYLAMALLSARSARATNPDLPIRIVTNVTDRAPAARFWDPERDEVVYASVDTAKNRDVKTRANQYSPFVKTVLLDCDTVVLGDLSPARELLRYFDVALRLKREPQRRKGKGDCVVLNGLHVEELPHWNSGVILFRSSPEVDVFFRDWNRCFRAMGSGFDQVSLVEAVFTTEARVLSLEDRWNATDPGWGRQRWRRTARVFHYATNISDALAQEVVAHDALIANDSSKETREFLLEKRRTKRKRFGALLYPLVRISWRLLPAVEPRKHISMGAEG